MSGVRLANIRKRVLLRAALKLFTTGDVVQYVPPSSSTAQEAPPKKFSNVWPKIQVIFQMLCAIR